MTKDQKRGLLLERGGFLHPAACTSCRGYGHTRQVWADEAEYTPCFECASSGLIAIPFEEVR